jgi:hypothetical protein
MLILGGTCALLAEAAELIVWFNDRRRALPHQDPFAAPGRRELSSLRPGGQRKGWAVPGPFILKLPAAARHERERQRLLR